MRAAAAEAGCTRRREASGRTRRRGREASQVQGHEGAPLDNSTVYCTFTAVHDGLAKYMTAHNTCDMLNSVKYKAKLKYIKSSYRVNIAVCLSKSDPHLSNKWNLACAVHGSNVLMQPALVTDLP